MKKIIITSLLLVSSAVAFADNSTGGFYIGVAPGYLSVDENDNIPYIGNVSANANGESGELFGGYQFDRVFALEVGAGLYHSSRLVNKTIYNVGVDVKGVFPFEQKFDVYGKLGYAQLLASGLSAPSLFYALGGDYKVTPHFSIGPSFQVNYGATLFGDVGFKQYAVAAKYSF